MTARPPKPRPSTKSDNLPSPREPVGHIRLAFDGAPDDNENHPLRDILACGRAAHTLSISGDAVHAVRWLKEPES
jgi:hypothetical protein